MSKLFEYVVLYHPKTKKDEERPKSELLVDVTRVLADSDREVAMRAAREVPDTYLDKLERVEICVRSF